MTNLINAISLVTLIIFCGHVNTSPVPQSDDDLLPKPLENPRLFLGDIKIRRNETSQDNNIFRNGIQFDDQLWPYAVVPIEIDPALDSHTNTIIQAIEEYHQKTCIRFQKRTTERDYLRFIYDEGCYSFVGRLGGFQTISLGHGCHCKGTVIHEMMHALGFYHEHNRSDRDSFVTINYDNISPGSENMFIKLSPSMNRLFTSYDYESIMHYDGAAFSKSPNLKTMIPTQDGVVLKHPCDKDGLSSMDIQKLNTMYQCNLN